MMGKVGRAIRSAALWTVGALWMAPMLTLMTILGWALGPRAIDGLSRIYCRGQVALTGSRWRAVVDPAVDPSATYLFVQNHVNLLDHVTMYSATPHFKQGVELEAHFRIPFYGWFMRARGTIPVRPGGGKELAIRVREEVAKGHSILAFPEGTRTRTGAVGPFRKGMFRVARDAGIAVVPVAVRGMFDVNRPNSWHLSPGDVTVYVLAPVPTAGVSDQELQALADDVRARIVRQLEAT